MLELAVTTVPEEFDDEHSRFLPAVTYKVRLEHSLVSVSNWESVFEKPFLGTEERSREETLAYVRMMCLDEIPPEVFAKFTSEHYKAINTYINARMTATTVTERPGAPTRTETITSELIYYWMISYNIPFECEKWHLNRLLMLVKVCNHKNASPKKMNKQEAAAERHRLNAQRRAALGSRG